MNNPIKTIVCYGDSNTWGNIPRTDNRYPRDIRWPGALQNLLGNGYEVISEGLCGRTFVVEDPKKPHRTGIKHLQSILETSDPIDLVIIMLGTNDVKSTYNLSAIDISDHLLQTIDFIKKLDTLEKRPKILVICPPSIIVPNTNDLDERMVRGIELFKTLPVLYKKVAENNDCGFINADEYISSSKIDGYHFDKEGHLKLANVVGDWVKNNLY